MQVGQIVCSAAGRDRGKYMVITGFDGNLPLVCDGGERPLERAKKKNPKHLVFADAFLKREQFSTNKTLRRELKRFSGSNV